jgi:hypothetical protein
MTRDFHVDDRVRLTRDVPEIALRSGEVGVVCSIWHTSPIAYEVEFRAKPSSLAKRTLVPAEQLELVDVESGSGSGTPNNLVGAA